MYISGFYTKNNINALGKDMSNNEKLTFNYLRFGNYHIDHVDGAIGNITPKGFLHIDFFSERAAIPKTVEYEFGADGQPDNSTENIIEAKEGIVRHIQSGIIMNKKTAIAVRDWIDKQIKLMEGLGID